LVRKERFKESRRELSEPGPNILPTACRIAVEGREEGREEVRVSSQGGDSSKSGLVISFPLQKASEPGGKKGGVTRRRMSCKGMAPSLFVVGSRKQGGRMESIAIQCDFGRPAPSFQASTHLKFKNISGASEQRHSQLGLFGQREEPTPPRWHRNQLFPGIH